MPGGFGTMDEFFETITLIQTKTLTQFPIVLFGKDYYKELMETIADMAKRGTISAEDMNLVLLTDDIEEAMQHIYNYITTNYKIVPRRRFWWLFERGRHRKEMPKWIKSGKPNYVYKKYRIQFC